MEHNQLILSAKDVNIQFNLRGKVLHAIRGIDLDLYQGEVLAIVGESGSGKSVLPRASWACWMPTAPLPAAPLITTAWRTASRCAFLTSEPKRTGCGYVAERSPWSCRTP